MSTFYKKSKSFHILMVSKPLAEPWNDSSKNLVRDLVQYLDIYKLHVFCPKGSSLFVKKKANVIQEFIYKDNSRYSPGLKQNIRVLLRLIKPDPEINVYHFFSAPNLLTSTLAKIILRFKRKKSVQNIMSTPKNYKNINKLIFADKVIVLSDYSKQTLHQRGIENVIKINPGLDLARFTVNSQEKLEGPNLNLTSGYILYAGDYEFLGAIPVILKAFPFVLKKLPRAKFVFSCRLKTKRTKEYEVQIKKKVAEMGFSKSTIFLNEVENMPALIKGCRLCIFPALNMYAKMDIPLVLLEALWFKKPIIISDLAPLNEIMKQPVGLLIKPGDAKDLARAIVQLMSDDNLAFRFGKNGREVVERFFNMSKIAKEYNNIYSNIYQEIIHD